MFILELAGPRRRRTFDEEACVCDRPKTRRQPSDTTPGIKTVVVLLIGAVVHKPVAKAFYARFIFSRLATRRVHTDSPFTLAGR